MAAYGDGTCGRGAVTLTGVKMLKSFFLLLGVVFVVGAGALLLKNVYDVNIMHETMRTYNAPKDNPSPLIAAMAGLAAVGGLLVGLGIGMPRRTRRSIDRDYEERGAAAGPSTG